MFSDIGTAYELCSAAADDIKVRRGPNPEGSIVMAARAWALAFEARQRQAATPSEGAELALYEAVADVTELRKAELALYQVILASEQSGK